jgi:hypothetical protein
MFKFRVLTICSVSPLLLLGNMALPQDLTLFEAVETPAGGDSAGAGEIREQRNLPNAPAFTLLGTSRIGDKRRVRLVDSNGEELVVEMSGNESTPIPDHIGYRIAEFEAGKVAIMLPNGTPCIGADDKGVYCGPNGMAELSLTTAAPIVVANTDEAANEDSGEAAEAEDGQPENPFAAALRAAAQNEANAQAGRGRPVNGGRFEVRRIAPEDVPPGKRVVRTPFGDRLVDL